MAVEATDRALLLAALEKVSQGAVLVLGDLYLDEYIVGRAQRLSREAPIPVLEFERQFVLPGGAANPACNLASLGCQVEQVGVVGADPEAQVLLAALALRGIGTGGVVVDRERPTTKKTRVLAQGAQRFPQQVARVDRQDRRPVEGAVQAALQARLAEQLPSCRALLVSDYRSGAVTEALAAAARDLAHRSGALATADSQGNLRKFAGYDLLKCNRGEAEAALGQPFGVEAEVRLGAEALVRLAAVRAVVVTLGGEGLALCTADGGYWRLPAANRSEVYDVTGAGDTVIALLTAGRLAGLPWPLAAALANLGAGLVVRKLGNATPTPEELRWAIEQG
ncbi:MAG: ribokinase [Chloroflexi bacterium]|nr:ribokinase [Chloroflexota bacterium]